MAITHYAEVSWERRSNAVEKVRPDHFSPAPDVSEATETFRLVSLEALVRMKLNSFRDKDRMHLRDLMEIGLVDKSWLEKVPNPLRTRLWRLNKRCDRERSGRKSGNFVDVPGPKAQPITAWGHAP